jgi:uncharacterized protein
MVEDNQEKKMDRLESVRQIVDQILSRQPDDEERRCGFVHLYGVSGTCTLLAVNRGLDPQVCSVIGMLHDIATYKTGDPTDHAQRSADEAEAILFDIGMFSRDEINRICDAIARHSDKDSTDGPLAELIKDADVLQHYLYNPDVVPEKDPHWKQRLDKVFSELGLAHHID